MFTDIRLSCSKIFLLVASTVFRVEDSSFQAVSVLN
jgi:hypothetical protein